jgi:SAM-dependent methyltransferase
MAQYQSFPDAAGDSRTLDKLKALRLPALDGKNFLDVGCNEGFFCGFAKFLGAKRSVGIDRSAEFIYRAQIRFPECEFHARDWEHLPDGQFDVILLASALHYAEDQPALIRRLVDKLAPDGVLILEMGIVSSPKAEWVKVKRGIDERYFPSMAQLKEVLVDYAWKWFGASVNQAGDPVARHVVHVSPRRPIAYLLMQPPAFGKSSVAARLFPPANIPIISGDQIILRIARNDVAASARLKAIVDKDYSSFAIDKTIQRIFDKKLGAELVDIWVAEAGHQDFALDGFVPAKQHAEVERQLAATGYMPVTLRWERVAPGLLPMDALDERARAFELTLARKGTPPAMVARKTAQVSGVGYVDEVRVKDGRVTVRGWAVEDGEKAPAQLVLGIGSERTFIDVGEALERKDVQKHLELPHARVGFSISQAFPGLASVAELGKRGFSVTLASGQPLRMTQPVTLALEDRGTEAG